jgi:serine/threonine-protein kinase
MTDAFEAGLKLGAYQLLEPIGSGGMAGVWAVQDEAGHRYALKSPASGLRADAGTWRRFAREAKAMCLIDHPNVVSVVDVFVEAESLYLVMELVPGRTLDKLVVQGPLAPRRALDITRQLLDGIGHAHVLGLVHRDIKPANIMVIATAEGEHVKILDFGIVKLIGEAEAAMGGEKLTRSGSVTGTPAFMSPEQVMGRPIDGRTDLYSLGILLFQMLTGNVPFLHRDLLELMRMQVKTPAPALDAVAHGQPWCTPELAALVARALAKDPEQRFANAQDMTAALDRASRSLDHVGH